MPSTGKIDGKVASVPDTEMLAPKRKPGETLRTFMARTIALHGLGTASGANRWCPPTMEWTTKDWEARVLECIPSDAERKCFLLADVLIGAFVAQTPSS